MATAVDIEHRARLAAHRALVNDGEPETVTCKGCRHLQRNQQRTWSLICTCTALPRTEMVVANYPRYCCLKDLRA